MALSLTTDNLIDVVFWNFKDVNIKYSYRDPQNALVQNDVFLAYFA